MDPNDFPSQAAGRAIRSPLGFWYFLPNPLPPRLDWPLSVVNALAEAERALSHLATLGSAYPFPRLLLGPIIRSEAVISSRIEGTHTSLEDLYTYETTQLPLFESGDDVREVHNYVRAMDYGLERLRTLPVSLRLIRELHAILMDKVRGGALTPGEFRRSQNWIGPAGSTLSSATYVPPPVEEMHQALGALEKFIHSETQIPPLVRAGLIHYQFESVHPFLDGNGRIGRLLTVLLFYEWGLLAQPLLNLSAAIDRRRQGYYDGFLAVSQRGDWETWLLFFLHAISQQADSDVSRLNRLQDIRARYQGIMDADRNPQRMGAMLDFLFSRPIFSVRQAADSLHIPFKTADDYMQKLVRSGVLSEVTGKTRNRIYRASEVFTAILAG